MQATYNGLHTRFSFSKHYSYYDTIFSRSRRFHRVTTRSGFEAALTMETDTCDSDDQQQAPRRDYA